MSNIIKLSSNGSVTALTYPEQGFAPFSHQMCMMDPEIIQTKLGLEDTTMLIDANSPAYYADYNMIASWLYGSHVFGDVLFTGITMTEAGVHSCELDEDNMTTLVFMLCRLSQIRSNQQSD